MHTHSSDTPGAPFWQKRDGGGGRGREGILGAVEPSGDPGSHAHCTTGAERIPDMMATPRGLHPGSRKAVTCGVGGGSAFCGEAVHDLDQLQGDWSAGPATPWEAREGTAGRTAQAVKPAAVGEWVHKGGRGGRRENSLRAAPPLDAS